MPSVIKLFLADQSGATAIEYALIAGFLSVAVIVGVTGVGSKLSARYGAISNAMP